MSARSSRRGSGSGSGQLYYGWVIVAVGFACSALSSPGQSFAIALYLDALIADLGMSRLALSSLYGVVTLLAAAMLPFVGRVADAISGRRYLMGVFVSFAVALAAFGAVTGPITLAIAWFCMRLLGQGAMSLGTLTVVVRWFDRRRARALSVVGLGFSAGEMLFPALLTALIAWLGWRGSTWTIAAAYALVCAPLVAVLVRERRPDTEPMDGDRGITVHAPPRFPNVTMRFGEAVRTRSFWLALLTVAVMPLVMTGLLFHQVAIFERSGWSTQAVPLAFVAYAWGGIAASVAGGMLLDHIDVHWGLLGAAVTGIAAVAVLPLGARAPTVLPLVYGGLLGAAGGFATIANSVLWPRYFGISALGSIKGVVNGVRNGATALGPPLVAALLESGTGTPRWGIIIALFVAMFVLALRVAPPTTAAPVVRPSPGKAP